MAMTAHRRVALVLACGLVVIAALLLAVLSQKPDRVISSNWVTVTHELGIFREHTSICQAETRIPAATTALRVSLSAIGHVGPAVAVTVSRNRATVAKGGLAGGWVSSAATLPLRPAISTPVAATICVTRGPGAMPVEIAGDSSSPASAAAIGGRALAGRMRVEYLKAGTRSWLSLIPSVARRLGLGHALSGTWIVLLLLALTTGTVVLAVWLLLREARHES